LKINISVPDTKKSYNVEIDDKTRLSFLGKKIKDTVNLSFIDKDLEGIITGGSNKDGFPMFPSLESEGTKKILIKNGIGFKGKRKGERARKRVAGKIVSENTQQINIKLTKGNSSILEEKYKKQKEESK
jgi:small subunit ribosomal protein S6e